jgi:hypothetical protein
VVSLLFLLIITLTNYIIEDNKSLSSDEDWDLTVDDDNDELFVSEGNRSVSVEW